MPLHDRAVRRATVRKEVPESVRGSCLSGERAMPPGLMSEDDAPA